MLAGYIRVMLLLELAAYAAIAEWLHFLYGWSYGALAALAVAAALIARLAMVCVTTISVKRLRARSEVSVARKVVP